MDLLRWNRCDWHLPHLRVSRHHYMAKARVAPHRHDFAEWFWIESGRLYHLPQDAASEDLGRGEARFLRPGAGHAMEVLHGCVLVTASMPARDWRALERRHGTSANWPWTTGSLRLSPRQLAWLAAAIAELPAARQDPSDADCFVAGMLRALRQTDRPVGAPPWLVEAVASLAEPPRLAIGLPALIGHCGRSAPHVSRAVRRHYGCTASALVLRLRLEQAARELRLGRQGILDLSQACGFASLAHFYRTFSARFGVTPAVFRDSGLT